MDASIAEGAPAVDPKAPLTFTIDGLGTFTFRRRGQREHVRITEEASVILGKPINEAVSANVMFSCMAIATVKVLLQAAPDDWLPCSIDDIDPLDTESQERLALVWGRLRVEEEARFRKSKAPVILSGAEP